VPVLEELGVKPVLNARGVYTDLGGSSLSPTVWSAMDESNRWFVDLPELLERSGEAIAALVGADAARVTTGAAAGLALGTAACLTGTDRAEIERLPDTGGMEARVLIQSGQRYKYDRCVRMVGAQLVETDRLEDELRTGAAAVCFPAHLDGAAGTLSFSETVELAHRHGVPVLVDGAYQIDPPERIRELATSGADLVCFSAKYYGGPNAAGFVCGSRELVHAVAANDFTRFESGEHHRYGRPFKLDRQILIATYVALREWLEGDHDERRRAYERRVESLRDRLVGIPGLELAPMCFTMEETLVEAPVNSLVVRGRPPERVDAALRQGTPSILAHVVGGAIVVVVETVSDEDVELLADRLAEALR
jgi:D-glucosaminate-6-phosphate ammonia-lyase